MLCFLSNASDLSDSKLHHLYGSVQLSFTCQSIIGKVNANDPLKLSERGTDRGSYITQWFLPRNKLPYKRWMMHARPHNELYLRSKIWRITTGTLQNTSLTYHVTVCVWLQQSSKREWQSRTGLFWERLDTVNQTRTRERGSAEPHQNKHTKYAIIYF